MRNIRTVDGYTVAIAQSDTSVGWVMADESGEVVRKGNRPCMGTYTFPAAEHADERRLHRSARRTLERKRARVREVEKVFAPHLGELDPGFLAARRESDRRPGDRAGAARSFDSTAYAGLWKPYPTMAHLRVAMLEQDRPFDPRLVFDVLVDAMKGRGNFVMDGLDVSSASSELAPLLADFAQTAESYFADVLGTTFSLDLAAAESLFASRRRSALASGLESALALGESDGLKPAPARRQLAKLLAGLSADLSAIDDEVPAKTTVCLSKEGSLDAWLDAAGGAPCFSLVEAADRVVQAQAVADVLSLAPGRSLSYNQVARYERYRADLAQLKSLAHRYCDPASVRLFFGGPKTRRGAYDKAAVAAAVKAGENLGYTAYDLNLSLPSAMKSPYENLRASVERLFDGTGADADPEYEKVIDRLYSGDFLRRIHTTDSRVVPYQLHAEEIRAILSRQGAYYPWLADAAPHLMDVLTSKIPYFVGPLSADNAELGPDGEPLRAWAVRKPGHERAHVSPWSVAEHIDLPATAEAFMGNLVGECTYLFGEKVLPRQSLVYQRFCLAEELANLRYTTDGDDRRSLPAEVRAAALAYAEAHRSVPVRELESLLSSATGQPCRLLVPKGTRTLACSLSSHAFFLDLFGVRGLSSQQERLAEDLTLWCNVYADRATLRLVLEDRAAYLTPDQVSALCRRPKAGWGGLSARLLTGLSARVGKQEVSVLDVVEHGCPYGVKTRGRSMNLMQALSDRRLGFRELIDAENERWASGRAAFSVDSLPGSPAMRRPIAASLAVLDDLRRETGRPAARIVFLNSARPKPKRPGKPSPRRRKQVQDLYAAYDGPRACDLAGLLSELASVGDDELGQDDVYLYFLQLGRCLYTGARLQLSEVLAGRADVSAIVPRLYRKDTSLANKALVVEGEGARRGADGLLTADTRRAAIPLWRDLRAHGLMSARKLANLTRSDFSETVLASHVESQLSETGYSARLFKVAAQSLYPDAEVTCLRASLVSEVGRALGRIEPPTGSYATPCHDALIALAAARFADAVWPDFESPKQRGLAAKRVVAHASGPERGRDLVVRPLLDKVDGAGGLWDGPAEADRLRSELAWKNIRLANKPTENKGGYWKQTLYTPALANPRLARKSDRPVEVYGGYQTETFAWWVVAEVEDTKKGRLALRMVPFPAVHAEAAKADPYAVDRYVHSLYPGPLTRVVRRRLNFGSVLEFNGERYMLRGQRLCCCYKAWVPPRSEADRLRFVSLIAAGADLVPAPPFLDGCWDYLCTALSDLYPELYRVLKVPSLSCPSKALAAGVPVQRIARCLIEVAGLMSNDSKKADTTPLGGVANAGKLAVNWDKLLNDPDRPLVVVDSSPTGLSESLDYLL